MPTRPPRDRHREIRKSFARHDMRTSGLQSVARCSKLGRQSDSERSCGEGESVDLSCKANGAGKQHRRYEFLQFTGYAFLRKIFSAVLWMNFDQSDLVCFARTARWALGDLPVSFLKTRLNCDSD